MNAGGRVFGVVKRSESKVCHWCGVRLCHKCRKASSSHPASCGGWWGKVCAQASTKDHLIPRTVQKSRRRHSGYKNPPPIVVACSRCNWTRGGMPVEDWLKVVGQ